ncbi:F-box protein At5g07610-like [Rhododendron vialii]|uniref:F-box protein At5g07610-like n=1 Tax=Rhododendron vialii TaxID=182163 RepID=UPI002660117B|nr:F-box protein At5g07610-like [Rhododendron vialii]
MDASSVRRNPIIGSASLDLPPMAEVIANNIDLLTQILLFFPAKSLIRFKSVSKHWLSLISDSQFAATHSRRNPRPSISGLFLSWHFPNCQTEKYTKSVSLQGHENRPTLAFLDGVGVALVRPKITHSSNGLLLCKCRYSAHSSDHYLVCNPTTKTHTLIPDPPEFSSGSVRSSSRAFLAFDPSKSPGYKVVFLGECYSNSVTNLYICVYCSKSASWKRFRVPDGRHTHEVLCGGVIYWLSHKGVVLGFDIDSEKMIEKSTNPPKIPGVALMMYFGECDGHLIFVQLNITSALEFIILEMDKDNSRWIVKFLVNLEPLCSMGSKFSYYCVLCVVKEDKEKDFQLVLDLGGTVVSYNVMNQTWNVLNDMAPGESVSYMANPYIESLSPL